MVLLIVHCCTWYNFICRSICCIINPFAHDWNITEGLFIHHFLSFQVWSQYNCRLIYWPFSMKSAVMVNLKQKLWGIPGTLYTKICQQQLLKTVVAPILEQNNQLQKTDQIAGLLSTLIIMSVYASLISSFSFIFHQFLSHKMITHYVSPRVHLIIGCKVWNNQPFIPNQSASSSDTPQYSKIWTQTFRKFAVMLQDVKFPIIQFVCFGKNWHKWISKGFQ